MAAEAEQQLSLTAALGLAEEPQPAPEPGPTRPRSRQRQAAPTAPPAATTATSSPDSDLPPWHHHGLVAAEQLTPMLRHYVELKAAHPDRVLLYRLGDFFEYFFEDAITL